MSRQSSAQERMTTAETTRGGCTVTERFDVEDRWPELSDQLDEARRRRIVKSPARMRHEGRTSDREDVKKLIDEASPVAGHAEPQRRAHTAPTDPRVFVRDVKPYEVPKSLDDLRGPAGGVVELPHTVLWAPGGCRVDLDEEGGVGLAYRAVVAEGTVADQMAILNRDRLMAAWPDLLLPQRARALWESRFPELRERASG